MLDIISPIIIDSLENKLSGYSLVIIKYLKNNVTDKLDIVNPWFILIAIY